MISHSEINMNIWGLGVQTKTSSMEALLSAGGNLVQPMFIFCVSFTVARVTATIRYGALFNI